MRRYRMDWFVQSPPNTRLELSGITFLQLALLVDDIFCQLRTQFLTCLP